MLSHKARQSASPATVDTAVPPAASPSAQVYRSGFWPKFDVGFPLSTLQDATSRGCVVLPSQGAS